MLLGCCDRGQSIPQTELVVEADIVPTALAKTRPQTVPNPAEIWRPFIEAKFGKASSERYRRSVERQALALPRGLRR